MWKIIMEAAVLTGIAGLLRSEYEKRHFKVEYYQTVSEKIKKNRTVVFLSDLHSQEFGKDNKKLLKAIDQVRPDLILSGGDMMICKGKRDVKAAKKLLEALADRYPVYCANGNHECRMREEKEIYGDLYEEYVQALKSAGVTVLSNETVLVDEDLAITGYDLDKKYYKKFKTEELRSEEIKKEAGPAHKKRYEILLAHSPLFFSAYKAWGADLSLAGHFHGGTIRLPLVGGVMTPQFQFFLPWCAGKFQENEKTMIVSRGLGTHSIRIRLFNKPQVVVVRLKNKTIF
ncbi:metallophosphoesterase [Lachnoclostridium edouardi]|uniref:metallophosphoesterase n=1 Tax=Lachnoclostridium edouardi TaxID=1926283 RepID=UPI000C79BED6|nr:metallophosphoesterase [Lachnoclostridium edouardi]